MSTFAEMKFKLARVGASDITKLHDDLNLLSVWGQIKREVAFTLDKGRKSIIAIGEAFSTFQVDMWSKEPWSFDTERNSMIIRLWSLLFSPTLQLCGGLLHETNHYSYLKINNMLGKPEPEQEEFSKKNKRIMETLAHEEPLEFLQRAEIHFPEIIRVPMPKGDLIYHKSEIIEKCRRNLLLWKETEDYSEDYEEDVAATGEKNYQTIAQALGMNLDMISRRRGGVEIRF